MNNALLFQIANFKVFTKMKCYLNNLDKKFILMIHLNSLLSENEIIEIKKLYPSAIYTYGENKGMDIYGFFIQIEYIINNNLNINSICKLHTKTDDIWRDELIYPIFGCEENIQNCINLLNNDDIGMVCSKKYFKLMDHYNSPIILNLMEEWNIENIYIDEIDWNEKYNNLYDLELFDPKFYITYPYNNIMYDRNIFEDTDKLNSYAVFHWLQIGYKYFKYVPYPDLIKKKNLHYKFCAGTMFWIKADVIIKFFKKINIKKYKLLFENGYFTNEKPTFTHSWERIFSLINYFDNKKIIDIL